MVNTWSMLKSYHVGKTNQICDEIIPMSGFNISLYSMVRSPDFGVFSKFVVHVIYCDNAKFSCKIRNYTCYKREKLSTLDADP